MSSDLAVPPLRAWPVSARIAALALLAMFAFGGAAEIAAASGSEVFVPIAMTVWAALAAYAFGRGRLALFVAVVPVYYGLAFGLAFQLDAPCSLRAPDPAIGEREGIVRWWPPHLVCELRMVDGSRQYDGGLPSMLIAPFLWACAASVLALVRRPHVAIRAATIAVAWVASVLLAFG